jgi:hypothetical protein
LEEAAMQGFPEHESVEAFVQFCLDDDRSSFSPDDVTAICLSTHQRRQDVRRELEGYGLSYSGMRQERTVRGFQSNSHDRWSAYPSHGGSGWEQIAGFAGREG